LPTEAPTEVPKTTDEIVRDEAARLKEERDEKHAQQRKVNLKHLKEYKIKVANYEAAKSLADKATERFTLASKEEDIAIKELQEFQQKEMKKITRMFNAKKLKEKELDLLALAAAKKQSKEEVEKEMKEYLEKSTELKKLVDEYEEEMKKEEKELPEIVTPGQAKKQRKTLKSPPPRLLGSPKPPPKEPVSPEVKEEALEIKRQREEKEFLQDIKARQGKLAQLKSHYEHAIQVKDDQIEQKANAERLEREARDRAEQEKQRKIVERLTEIEIIRTKRQAEKEDAEKLQKINIESVIKYVQPRYEILPTARIEETLKVGAYEYIHSLRFSILTEKRFFH
jgi:hypothetical protein